MDIIAQEKKNSKRYLPHTVNTKEGAVLEPEERKSAPVQKTNLRLIDGEQAKLEKV